MFPNRPTIRAQMLWRHAETLFRFAMPSLVGKSARFLFLADSSRIQLLLCGLCWTSQVSDLGLTS